MSEEREAYSEEEITSAVNKYKSLLKDNQSFYFDVFEYEGIIDYFFDNSQLKLASKAISQACSQHPDSLSLKIKKAQYYIYDNHAIKALEILNLAENLENNNLDIQILKGNAFLLQRKPDEAEKHFKKVLVSPTKDIDKIVYDIALSFEQTGYYKYALKYLKKAMNINPQNSFLLFDTAVCLEKEGDIQESIIYYKKYLEKNPFSIDTWNNLANLYYENEEFDNAIESYDYALALDPKLYNTVLNKANCCISIEKYDEAIKSFLEYTEYNGSDPVVNTYIGECYEKLEQYNEAIKYYEEALKKDNKLADAWFGLGLVKMFQKNYSESLKFLNKAITFDGNNSEYYFALGNINSKLGQNKKALNAYREAIEHDPEDVESWLASAEIMAKEGKTQEAINFLESGYEFTNGNAIINYRLAAYYGIEKNNTKALKYFKDGLKLNYNEHSKILVEISDKEFMYEIQHLIKQFKTK